MFRVLAGISEISIAPVADYIPDVDTPKRTLCVGFDAMWNGNCKHLCTQIFVLLKFNVDMEKTIR